MNSVIAALLTLLETSFTTTFVKYFHGQQQVPADADLPICMVYPIRTMQKRSGTLRDQVEYTIAVEVQVDLKAYYDNTNGQGNSLDSLLAVEALLEDRETDGDLKTNTVMGIINANLTVSGKVLYTDDMQIDYTISKVENDVQRIKAIVTFTAYDRPNRV
jgi:hypothetical protein